MKTQLLYLDPHDDTASTREKLRWVQADRVVLVWPPYGRVLHRRVDLVLVKREAARQAAQLGVVSHDPDVRAHALELRLPIFDDLESLSPDAWPAVPTAPVLPVSPPGRKPASELRPRPKAVAVPRRWDDVGRAGWMLIVILALLALSIVVGPAAVIELTPATRPAQTAIQFVFAEDPVDEEGVVWIPSRRLEVEVEDEIRLPTRGTVMADTATASGSALFTNREETEQMVPGGTGLRTLGDKPVRFETTARAIVPPGIGGEVLVPIRATEAGEAGNVAAEAILAVEGTLGLQLTVSNPEATSGGVTQPEAGVTGSDLTRAQQALERQLLQEGNASLLEQLADGEALVPDSVAIGRVVNSDHRPQVGEPSESVLASLALVVEAVAFREDRLTEQGLAALQEIAGAQEAVVPESIRLDLIPTHDLTVSGAKLYRGAVSGETYPAVDPASLSSRAAGRAIDQARSQLTTQTELKSPPVIRLWPSWWPRLPLLPWRIQLVWTPSWASGP